MNTTSIDDRAQNAVPGAAINPGNSGGASASGTGNARRRRALGTPVYWLVGILTSIAFIAPLGWAVFRSFDKDLATSANSTGAALSIHSGPFRAYIGLIADLHFLTYVWNSVLIGLGTGVLTTILSALAGYGLARFDFRGKGVMFAAILLVFMIPFQALLTPVFLELDVLHLTNSRIGLVLFYTTFNLPFGVFVMRNTFHTIPVEIEESAAVDGATIPKTLRHVLLPLVVPGLATVTLYAFLWSWTEFLAALTLLTDDSKIPVAVALQNLALGQYGTVNFGYLIAGTVLAMLPCVILYLSLQRYYVQGLLAGSVKS